MEPQMLSEKDLHGTWTLKSWMVAAGEQDQFQDFWTGVHGQLMYATDGQMSVILVHPEWEVTGNAPIQGFREGVVAYSGSYSVESHYIQHHVQHTNIRPWIGQTLIRQAAFEDNALVLTSPTTEDTQGQSAVHRLTWVRLVLNRL
jgi:hypothetical protein